MKRSRIRLCTLAIGDNYRAMARRLARDLTRFAPDRKLLIGTDRPGDFHESGNASVFPIFAEGRWSCYNAKRLVLREALSIADVAIHIDADSRIIAPLPLHGPWISGLTAPHENLRTHLERWWPSWVPEFGAVATSIGLSSAEVEWIGESIYAVVRDNGRELDFIENWRRLAELLAPKRFPGGEGNIMGLAAAKAGLAVQRGRWEELDAARRHLNASNGPSGRRLTPPDARIILSHGKAPRKAKALTRIVRSRDLTRAADGPGASHRSRSDDRPRPDDRLASRLKRPTVARPLISVIVISRNEGDNLRRTVLRLAETLPARAEILVVDDSSKDGSAEFLTRRNPPALLLRAKGLGVTNARNFGARRTRGDVVLFADAHVDTPDRWAEPLLEAVGCSAVGAAAPGISVMGHPERIGYGLRIKGDDLSTHWLKKRQSNPYPVPIAPGCFLAMKCASCQPSS